MKRLMLAATLAAAPATAVAKDAKFVEASAVADKPTVALDPARGHILLRSPSQISLYLMKMPSEQDRVVYDSLREEALADARKSYARKLAAYERDRKAVSGTQARQPEKLIEPTEANFEFTPFELLATVPIGPMNRFAKGQGGASTYLHAVTPGRYRVYGPIAAGANGAMVGACYCMGSVSFEARAGEIVDIGALANLDAPIMAGAVVASSAPKGHAAAPPLDPRLTGMMVRPAQFRPVGKLPNHFGIAITRLPEMAGVMRYDRDRIVDLTGGGQ